MEHLQRANVGCEFEKLGKETKTKAAHPSPAVPPPKLLQVGLPQHGQEGGVDWDVETQNQYRAEPLGAAHLWQPAGTFEGEDGEEARSGHASSPQAGEGTGDVEQGLLSQVDDLHRPYIQADEEEGEEARCAHLPQVLKIQAQSIPRSKYAV